MSGTAGDVRGEAAEEGGGGAPKHLGADERGETERQVKCARIGPEPGAVDDGGKKKEVAVSLGLVNGPIGLAHKELLIYV